MNKNKVIGIILLVLCALSVIGCFANGTFANLQGQSFAYYLGLFGGAAVLFILGILNLVKGFRR